MKNRHYSTFWKNTIIILQMVLTVIFVLSFFLLASLNGKRMLETGDLANQNFTESGYYRSIFQDKAADLIYFLESRRKFETDGVYNAEKTVNIIQYARSGVIYDAKETGTPAGTSYRDYEMYSDEYYDALLQMDRGEFERTLFEYYRLGDLTAWSREGYVSYPDRIEEKYLPIEKVSIADGIASELLSKEDGEELYKALAATLDNIGDEEEDYKRKLNEFDNSETNFFYVFAADNEVLYSNVEDYGIGKTVGGNELLDYAKEKGSYFYSNDMDLKFRTNVQGMEDYYYNYMDGRFSKLGRNVVFMMAVDTTFPYADDFSEAGEEFTKLQPWAMVSIVAMVITALNGVMALVYLTLAAGRKTGDDKVHLNWLDKVKTELFFFLFAGFSVALITLSFAASGYEWNVPGMLVMTGVLTFIYDGVFLIFYMSMIRRIKANVLWEYSLTRWLIVSTRRVIGTWRSSVRIIVEFLLFAGFFLLLTYKFFTDNSIPAGILLLMLLAAAGVTYLRDVVQKQEIMKGIRKMTEGNLAYKIPLDHLHNDSKKLAEAVNNIGEGLHLAVEENTKNERMKADLITNVSHDIKTPLTSIINYVNLMKMEDTDNERMQNYIGVLEEKSQRLRQLTEDLVEASRISSGNIVLQMTPLNFVELVYQTAGEFNEKFENKELTTITKLPKESVRIMADGRRIWRVLENLYNNVAKYALAHTRVYVTMEKKERTVDFTIKNISEQPLDINGADLTERFIRGDESRSTEGSGLGLSIAQNLTTMMGGTFDIGLDGDLFSVTITFPLV